MLIYNGDLDSMANILHTEAFAESLAKKVTICDKAFHRMTSII